VGRRYLPNRILAHDDPASGNAPDLPLLRGKGLVGGKAALYVCRNFACRAPITDPSDLDHALAERPGHAPGEARVGIAARRAGRATPDGTATRARRFVAEGLAHGYGPLGGTGLTVSRIGFGCYRLDDETPAHREALIQALLGGCTLIDTSTNYMDGESERLVGSVLAELERDGRVSRQDVVVVSKIGYVQGQNLTLAREREAAGKPFPDMVKYMEGCWHCIHPEFLQDQLNRSLERLQLGTLDVCLLHNPEYFFSDAKRRRTGRLEELRDQFYRRLAEAFAFFERQVAAGRIAWYGVSSNTSVSPADDAEATSLSRMLDAAVAAGGPGHHFRILQVPLNLFESGAAREANTGAPALRPVLDVAAEAGIAVLTNRPLNAYHDGKLIRLADVPLDDAKGAPSPDEALPHVAALEEEFRLKIGARLRVPEGSPPTADWFRWADQLRAMTVRLDGLDHWRQIEEQMISPAVGQLVQMLDASLSGPIQETWRSWLEQYLPALDSLLQAFRARAARQSQAASNRVTAALNPHLPLARRGESLSRKALWVLVSTPGVSTVLLGMRHPDYVTDGLEALKWPPLGDVRRIYEAMRGVRVG
jgi:aryl-alcohol dehydrogenase-like predicted oxidoreductase